MAIQGHGFGIFLGHVPEFAQDPPLDHVLRILGQAGFIRFDEIKTFLGEAALKEVLTKFTQTYWGRVVDEIKEEIKAEASAKTRLVDVTGKPIQ
jgi:hypothetical protein